MQHTLKIYWPQYLPSPMVECNLNPWLEFLAAQPKKEIFTEYILKSTYRGGAQVGFMGITF